MLQKYLYHVTDEEHLPLILKHGLIPQIAKDSVICDEHEEAIYLSDCRSILCWQILLDKPVVIRFPISVVPVHDLEKFEHLEYNEYITHQPIPAECIQKVSMRMPKNKDRSYAMQIVCKDYIYAISDICVRFARHYMYVKQNEVSNTETTVLEHMCKTLLTRLPRLNYKCLPTWDKLLDIMDICGHPVFLDIYANTGCRLYEILLEYPDDKFTNYRKQLYDYIIQTFRNELHLNTGRIEIFHAGYKKYELSTTK